jgi:23S rRNA pseudouridine2604 synthase
MGTKISIEDEVRVDGKLISEQTEQPVYIAFNKPIGIVCTTDTGVEKDNIIDYINYPKRIFPIGRLDKDSQGLLLMTNDGELSNKLAHPRYQKEKEYLVVVNKEITSSFILNMGNGVLIDKKKTQKCIVEKVEPQIFKIIMKEGRNRQIRKMSETLGYKVKNLLRIRVGPCKLGELKLGKFRVLSKKEIKSLTSA